MGTDLHIHGIDILYPISFITPFFLVSHRQPQIAREVLNGSSYFNYFWIWTVRQFELHTTIVDDEV